MGFGGSLTAGNFTGLGYTIKPSLHMIQIICLCYTLSSLVDLITASMCTRTRSSVLHTTEALTHKIQFCRVNSLPTFHNNTSRDGFELHHCASVAMSLTLCSSEVLYFNAVHKQQLKCLTIYLQLFDLTGIFLGSFNQSQCACPIK